MRKLFSLIAAVLFAGSMMADVTVTKYVNDLFPNDANGTQEPTLYSDANLSISVNADGNNGKVYGSGTEWRLYQTNSPIVTVAATNATIKTVAFEFTVKNTGALKFNDAAMTSNVAVTVNAESAQFIVGNSGAATNGQVIIKGFTIVYDGEGGGDQPGGDTTVVPVDTTEIVPLADPTNCAEAAEAALSVSANNELYNNGAVYTINGYVTNVAYKWSKGTMSFWMADAVDGGKVLEAYKCAIENEADTVTLGDKVAVTGQLTKYNETPEFAAGCTVSIIERAQQDTTVTPVDTIPPVVPEDTTVVPVEGGTEVIFTNADFAGQGTANTGSEVTATKDGVTFTCSKGYSAEESLRCYAHGTLSITASSIINKINFTTTGGRTGGLDAEVEVNATSYEVADLASQARFTEIKVTLGEGGDTTVVPVDTTEIPVDTTVVPVDTLSCAAAAELALSGNTDERIIKGYVTDIVSAWQEQYKNVSFWMADAVDGGKVFEAYRVACATAEEAPGAGDLVWVKGNLKNYNGTPETNAGGTFGILVKAEVVPVDTTEIPVDTTVVPVDEVVMAKGETAYDDNTVNGQFAIKVGTSSKSGNMTITVPAGATELSFYAVAWKGAPGTISVSANGATISPEELTLEANDAISGSGKAFTIDDVDSYLYKISLPGAESSLVITLASGTAKRFVVWGASCLYGEVPVEGDVWVVTGNNADLFGGSWDLAAAPVMELKEGMYVYEKAGVALAKGSVEIKVVFNRSWDNANYPKQNYVLSIAEDGIYDVQVTFNPESKAVNAVAEKKGDVVIDHTVAIRGFNEDWTKGVDLTLSEDKSYAKGIIALEAGDQEFKVVLDGGQWRSNAAIFDRESSEMYGIEGNENGNMLLKADVAGDYEFTWFFESNGLKIAFPEKRDTTDVPVGEAVVLVMEDYAATSFSDKGITVATAKNGAANDPIYNSTGKDLRIYAKGSITISAEQNISAISFVISTQGKKRLAPLTANVGNVVVAGDPDFTAVWTGSATEVTLTVGDKSEYGTDGASKAGQLDFTAIEIILGEGDTTVVPVEPVEEFYLVGSFNGWTANEDYKFKANEASEGEYMLKGVQLAARDSLKVFGILGETTTWYPGGENYVVAKDGEYDIYFRPDYQGGEDWYAGCLYLAEKAAPADPTNCAEAAAAALSVSGNNVYYNDSAVYTIEGYVTSIATAYNSQYNNITFWMADAVDGGNVLEAYRAVCTSADDAPEVGDKVQVTGALTKYGTTPEFGAGCTYVIIEKGQLPDPVNLGEKTIAEFIALKNMRDTCILTGVVDSIKNTQYGNLYLSDETGQVYVYGVLTAAGESKKFAELGVEVGDTLTIKAIYNEYNNTPQVKNGIFVEVKKAEVAPVVTDPTNCAEAAAAALSVSGNNVYYNDSAVYTIEGYVTSIATAYNSQYNNITFWMADAVDGGNVLEAYRAVCTSAEDAPEVGDKVQVTGALTKYGTTPEFGAGCTYVIIEKGQLPDPVNLGEKTIAEFIALKNMRDTCILTGVVDSIKNIQYGNLYLSDETGQVYVYGVLTADGQSKQFESLGVEAGDILTIKAIYNEYNNTPQVKNAIFVSVTKTAAVKVHMSGEDVTYQDNVADEGWWQIVAQNDDYYITLSNSNTVNQAAGTYSAEDLLEEYSFLISGNDTTAIYFVAGSITLTEAADGSVTIAGQLKGDNNITYDILLVYDETTTGIDNSAVEVKAVKVIREGMLFIEKAGVKYNVIGQKIR